MPVQLNHTIVAARDHVTSAEFLARILGLAPARAFAHFMVVTTANDVSLDYRAVEGEINSQHYAFLVAEEEFDEIFDRISAELPYWADPGRSRPGEINRRDGGRGVYFQDPNGHLLEILTRPYGSGNG